MNRSVPDLKALEAAEKVRVALQEISGGQVDSGAGTGSYDFWVRIDGAEH